MIVADIILIVISLAALIFASITDIKIKEVPDWLSYGLIASGLIIRLLNAITFKEYSYFIYGILGFGSMFIVGELLYHGKLWGGGDAKLLMGLGATLATTPFYLESSKIPFLLIVLMFILFTGALYGLSWSIFLIFKEPKKFKTEFKKMNQSQSSKIIKILSMLLVTLFLIAIILLPINGIVKIFSSILMLLFLVYPYLFIAVKSLENIHLYVYLPTSKIVEGDWIARDVKINNKLVFSKKTTVTKRDIKHLKDLNIKRVLVKDGIPFVPPFLIGTIIALLIGNPLS